MNIRGTSGSGLRRLRTALLTALTVSAAAILQSGSMSAQCTEAPKGSITIFMFDLQSTDIPQEHLYRMLDILSFKLNNAVREQLNSRGLLGGAKFSIRWCSGRTVTAAEAAVKTGKRLNSAGVFWGFLDQSTGTLRSALKLTALVEEPITDLRNILYRDDSRAGIDDSYIAFAAYIVGKTHQQRGDLALARKSFRYARDLRALPDLLQKDCGLALAQIDAENPARKLSAVGR